MFLQVSVCPRGGVRGGGCVVGGVGGIHGRGCTWGACMGSVHRGHAWGACMAGGHAWWGAMHGRGACMVGSRGMYGRRGLRGRGGHAWQILRDTVNERSLASYWNAFLFSGVFRPLVDGVYQLTFYGLVAVTDVGDVYVKRNDDVLCQAFLRGNEVHDTATCTVVAELTTGDSVRVTGNSAYPTVLRGESWSGFAGFLIYDN